MIRICWRAPQTSSFALISWKRNVRICVVLLAVGFVCTRGVCQSTPDRTGNFRINAGRIEASSPARLTFHWEAAGQEASPDGMQLSLQQAIHMALERNLDIQLEEPDQSVADFSLTRTQAGATPRAINFNIAEAPSGEVIASVPLLATTSPTLSPYGMSLLQSRFLHPMMPPMCCSRIAPSRLPRHHFHRVPRCRLSTSICRGNMVG